MQERTVRVTITTLLLSSLLVAAFFLRTLEQRTANTVALAGDVDARLSRLSDTISAIGTAHQAYVAPGQLDEPWFERASTLTDELAREIELARERLRSPQASDALQELASFVATLTATDARTRQNLRIGQELMASDVIFSDGRNLLDAMTASLRDLQAAERVQLGADLSALARRRWLTLSAIAALWFTALLVLAVRSTRAPADAPRIADHTVAQPPAAVQPNLQPRTSVDLGAAASVCTDLSRITTTAELPGLLGRAAGALDASGVILWISAGDQLFPVMGHGYDDDLLARMRPVGRDAENAAASAWRTGQLTVVPAAHPGAQGAIVTPLFGLHRCIGVLSAELRQGEDNPTVQAVATMIAAQLSTVVPAWPAGSLTPPQTGTSSEARSA